MSRERPSKCDTISAIATNSNITVWTEKREQRMEGGWWLVWGEEEMFEQTCSHVNSVHAQHGSEGRM